MVQYKAEQIQRVVLFNLEYQPQKKEQDTVESWDFSTDDLISTEDKIAPRSVRFDSVAVFLENSNESPASSISDAPATIIPPKKSRFILDSKSNSILGPEHQTAPPASILPNPVSQSLSETSLEAPPLSNSASEVKRGRFTVNDGTPGSGSISGSGQATTPNAPAETQISSASSITGLQPILLEKIASQTEKSEKTRGISKIT